MMRARTATAAIALAALLAGCDAPAPQAYTTTPVAAIDAPPPTYPIELACEGIGGTVHMMVTVGADGGVANARLDRSSGSEALDAVALESVRDWRFRAATTNGQPVATDIAVPMTFNVPAQEPEDCYYVRAGQPVPGADG